MENVLIDDENQVFYVIKVGNETKTPLFENKTIAEMSLTQLSLEEQQQARVVPVTKDGREILLG